MVPPSSRHWFEAILFVNLVNLVLLGFLFGTAVLRYVQATTTPQQHPGHCNQLFRNMCALQTHWTDEGFGHERNFYEMLEIPRPCHQHGHDYCNTSHDNNDNLRFSSRDGLDHSKQFKAKTSAGCTGGWEWLQALERSHALLLGNKVPPSCHPRKDLENNNDDSLGCAAAASAANSIITNAASHFTVCCDATVLAGSTCRRVAYLVQVYALLKDSEARRVYDNQFLPHLEEAANVAARVGKEIGGGTSVAWRMGLAKVCDMCVPSAEIH